MAVLGKYFEDFCAGSSDMGQCEMDYLHKQVDDVKAAIDYLKTLYVQKGLMLVQTTPRLADAPDVSPQWLPRANTLPLVDSSRIAIMGHSYGGIVSVFANERDLGQKVIVYIAGASQSWGNETVRDELKKSVEKALKPAFFLEPMNDASIEPTCRLAKHAAEKCRQFQAALFGPVDINDDGVINDVDYAPTTPTTATTCPKAGTSPTAASSANT